MKVLVAPNAFKGALTAAAAARAIAAGIRASRSRAQVRLLPVADGGDGTLAVLAPALGLRFRRAAVIGPLGEKRRALWAAGRGIAVVELAQAAGLALVPASKRNPLHTTTFGVGELVRAARGARRVILTVGGSATVDGGLGLLQALGARIWLDGSAAPLDRPAMGRDLARVSRVEMPPRCPALLVITDVASPLVGPRGAARVFGPQKGADAAAVKYLERGLARWARLILRTTGADVSRLPGGGAAGGVPAALAGLAGARLVPGTKWILEALGLERHLRWADVVVTGEGRLDSSTFAGKAPAQVLALARKHRKPAYIIAGARGPGHARVKHLGARALFLDQSVPEIRRIAQAAPLLKAAAFKLFSEKIP